MSVGVLSTEDGADLEDEKRGKGVLQRLSRSHRKQQTSACRAEETEQDSKEYRSSPTYRAITERRAAYLKTSEPPSEVPGLILGLWISKNPLEYKYSLKSWQTPD